MSSAPVEQNTQTVSLSEVLSALRRRRLTVVVFALLGLLCGGIYSILSPATYSATAVVALTSLPDNPLTTGTPRPVNAATETQVARSTEVLKLATDKLGGGTTPSQLSRSLTVSSPVDSQAITITVDATTPTAAADGSNAVAQAYLEFRSDGIKNQIDALAETLDAQIEDLTRQQAAAQASIAARAPADRAGVQVQAQTISNVLERQREQRATLDTSLTQVGQQVGVATPPGFSSGMSQRVLLLAGLAIGLVLGVVLALVRDRTDRRIISADQVRSRLHIDVLAEIDGRRSTHHQYERYQRLATVLAAESSRSSITPLLVASVDDVRVREVAARLATALARHLRPLALVCTAEAAANNTAAVETRATAGSPQVIGLSAESSIQVGEALHVVDPRVNVMIDGADVRMVSTTIALAATARTAVVVIQLGTTRTVDLRSGLRDLSAAGVHILGAVLLREGRRNRRGGRRTARAPEPVTSVEPVPAPHAPASPVGALGTSAAEVMRPPGSDSTSDREPGPASGDDGATLRTEVAPRTTAERTDTESENADRRAADEIAATPPRPDLDQPTVRVLPVLAGKLSTAGEPSATAAGSASGGASPASGRDRAATNGASRPVPECDQ